MYRDNICEFYHLSFSFPEPNVSFQPRCPWRRLRALLADSFPAILQGVLRNIHQFTVLERRLMRDDATDCHVEGLGHIHERLAV